MYPQLCDKIQHWACRARGYNADRFVERSVYCRLSSLLKHKGEMLAHLSNKHVDLFLQLDPINTSLAIQCDSVFHDSISMVAYTRRRPGHLALTVDQGENK